MTDVYGGNEGEELPDESPEDLIPIEDGLPTQEDIPPLYRIYEDSRIAVGSAVGPMWRKRYDAAKKAYEHINNIWEQLFSYYNNNQNQALDTPQGQFRRGDNTENILYSNINIVAPAIYSQNPNITCSTSDKADEQFCRTLETLLNTLMKRRDKLHAKTKIKRAVFFGLLTNFGVMKLDFVKKDDSREHAQSEFHRITQELSKAKTQAEVECLYGELEALEHGMEVLEPAGPSLRNVLPHKLIIDPFAEQTDGMDAMWMAEELFLSTSALNAKFTKPDPEIEPDEYETEKKDYKKNRVLVYKPTHKASFEVGGSRDDGLGIVLEAMATGSEVEAHTDAERRAYQQMYYTECVLVWDKYFRRVYLFHRDDWTWPIWVWDDPLNLARFFPYFIIGFGFSTGGTVNVGDTAYYLDQQDEINDINRQWTRIRRTIFNYFFFNSDKADPQTVEALVKALRGETQTNKAAIGVRAGEGKISEIFEAVMPPSMEYKELFDKTNLYDTVNRISSTSDALRGVQFKTNTNVPAIETYQQSTRLSTGAKVDVVEDTVSDLAYALAELCVMNLRQEDVAALIGEGTAAGWKEMSIEDFRTQYSLELVAGSMEKPNSQFKKKEALEVAQAVGQFAQAAPGASLKIMLRVLSGAFTDVHIKPEDWEMLNQEVTANLQKGISTQGNGGAAAAPQGGQPQGGQPQPQPQQQTPAQQTAAQQPLPPELENLPDPIKQRVVEMAQQGAPNEEIAAFIQQALMQTQAQPIGANGGYQGQ
jgi:hypothetical protein